MQKLEWAASVLAAHELLMDQLGDEARALEILDRTMQRSWNTTWNRFLARRVASSVRPLVNTIEILEDKGDGHRADALGYLAGRVPSNARRNEIQLRKVMNGLLSHYGTGWRWKYRRPEDDPEAVIIWATHCFYTAFMENHGHPELTPLLRNIDNLWLSMPGNRRGAFRVEPNAPRAPEDAEHPIVFKFINA